MRSASWSASSRFWVVRKMVTPAATSLRMICHMVWRLRGSRPVVGSSRKNLRRPVALSAGGAVAVVMTPPYGAVRDVAEGAAGAYLDRVLARCGTLGGVEVVVHVAEPGVEVEPGGGTFEDADLDVAESGLGED